MRYLFSLLIICTCLTAKATSFSIPQDTTKRASFFALPIAYYTPETRWAFGGAAIYAFRFKGESSTSRPSQLQLGFAYTLNKQALVYLPFELYFKKEHYKLYGELGYYRYNYFFYGIGNEQSELSEELYGVNYPRLRLNALYLVRPNLYAGIRYWMDDYIITEKEAGGLLASQDILGNTGGLVSGLGFVSNYDTRNQIFAPSKGFLIELAVVQNGRFTASDYTYTKISLDAAKYLAWKKQVFAFNVYTEMTFGDAPFNELALLGGNRKMRGYYQGRYRDNHVAILQVEYRIPLFWRLGAVVFGAYGGVSESLQQIQLQDFRYTAGAGLRIMISKKDQINLRIDVALGEGSDSPEFYITVGEAF